MSQSDSKKTFSLVDSKVGSYATRSSDHQTQISIKANTINGIFNLQSATPAVAQTSSKRKRPRNRGKVGVVVIYRHTHAFARRRIVSTDTAGTFISQFFPGDIPRGESTRDRYVQMECKLHQEGAEKYIAPHLMDVSWAKLRYLHEDIIRWMKDQHRLLRYLGPAYPRGSHGTSKYVADTQLYVTGGIEDKDGDDIDTAAENAARREVAEEIGLPIHKLVKMKKRQGNYWFVAEV